MGKHNADALLEACQLIASALGLSINLPSGAASPVSNTVGIGTDEMIAAILHTARLRSRRVALRGDWWSRDARDVGPLLAFIATDSTGKRPVALLPDAGGSYMCCNPTTGERQRLTPQLAKALDPFAFTFFRTFASHGIGVVDLLRFGLRGCERDMLMVLLASGAAALLGLSPVLATSALFNWVIPTSNGGVLIVLVAGLIIAALSSALFQFVRSVSVIRIESRMNAALQAASWDRLLQLPVSFFGNYSAGDLATRLSGLDLIRQTMTGVTLSTVLTGIFSLVNLALLLLYDPRLAVLAMGLVVIATFIMGLVGYASLRYTRQLIQLQSRVAGLVLQLVGGISRLRVPGAETRAFGAWARLFNEQRRLAFRERAIGNGLTVFNAAYPTLALLTLFGAIALSGPSASATGTVIAFVAAFNALLAAGLGVSANLLAMLRTVPLFENASPILRTEPEVNPVKIHPGELLGAIKVSGAAFRYQTHGPTILDDVSIEANPGEFVAIVGPSGSGKSTLLRLLLGFEQPESGTVTYDGKDLASLDLQAVRRQIGVVLQNTRLTPGDIFNNIVGSSLMTLDDAWEAARLAGLEDDIRQMPMGMHTMVSEGGSTFSGGQRQRLAIARAIVAKPRMLFFDEATSALDNRTQAIVSQSLQSLRSTRIVIAHRLSTVMHADRIYVIVAGRIRQRGMYAELAAQPGPFYELIKRQLV